MNHRIILGLAGHLVLAACSASDANWPQFRGHHATGIGSGQPPTSWDVESGRNIEWKATVPGLGHSAPVVWNKRVYLTTALSSDDDAPSVSTGWLGGGGESAADTGTWTWQVLCLDLTTGKPLWTRNAHRGEPVIRRHLKASHANCTPATDGKHVVAFFGSEGLFCFDQDGRQLWKRDFGRLHSGPYDAPDLQWGFSSSPVIFHDKVIVQCDCLNINFVAVLDIRSGDELLRIERNGEVATWSTPTIIEAAGRTQIVCNGYRRMAAYDLQTGEELWHLKNGGDVPVPTPLFAHNLIYLTNGHGRSPLYAVRPSARGDLTPSTDAEDVTPGLAWWQPRAGSYMPTPLISNGIIYVGDDNGRLTTRDAVTGELIYRERIGTGSRTYSASPVAAGGNVYFTSERGEISVVAEGNEFRQISTVDMGETTMATPAISGDRLLIRTQRHCYCIAEKQNPASDLNEPTK